MHKLLENICTAELRFFQLFFYFLVLHFTFVVFTSFYHDRLLGIFRRLYIKVGLSHVKHRVDI